MYSKCYPLALHLTPPLLPCLVGQGWFVALPILLSFVGLVMVGVGGFSCEMMKVTDEYYNLYTYYGFTSLKRYGSCSELIDTSSAFKAGNAFAILATLIGVLTVIAAILTTFIRFPPQAILGMAISSFVVAGCSVIVTGVGFADPGCALSGQTCSPGSMMYVAMFGAFFWIAAGAAFLFVRKYEREGIMDENVKPTPAVPAIPAAAAAIDVEAHNDELPTTVIEMITNPDGTQTRTTTVTSYKDGRKVVETTSETI